MTLSRRDLLPVTAEVHSSVERRSGVDAATMLTIYLVLLVAIPSDMTITALGGLGRPAFLWGLVLLLWWVLARLQAREKDVQPIFQPVRFAFAALVVVALVSFAAAMLRGQPADQISPATTALLRLASWGGVLLVAMDGIRTSADAAKLARRLTIAGAALAAFGLAQFITGQSLLDWINGIPGLTVDTSGVATRSSFTRASGTAIHPLEYATAVVAALPLAITTAVNRGFRGRPSRYAAWWWLAVGLILLASLVAVSRSAIIGLAVAGVASLPAIPRAYRWVVAIGGAAIAIGLFALVPGMFGTIMNLFMGVSDDPSAQSRVAALSRVPEFLSSSPVVGQGFGTFLPRYYIFDDAWVLVTVELGVLGLLCLAGLAISAIGSALWASGHSLFADTTAMSRAFAASLLTIAILFLFFDGLSFPISGGLFFLVAGLAAAMRTIAAADRTLGVTLAAGSQPEPADAVPAAVPPARSATTATRPDILSDGHCLPHVSTAVSTWYLRHPDAD